MDHYATVSNKFFLEDEESKILFFFYPLGEAKKG